jgi:Nucleotide modification associated domain 5
MTKLTNQMRTALVEHALVAGRLAGEAELVRRERALALRLTRHRYGDDVFDRCRALPEGWVDAHRTISFDHWAGDNKLGFPVRVVYAKGPYGRREHYRVPRGHRLELDTAVPLPNSFAQAWTRAEVGSLYDEVYAYFEAVVARHDEEEALRASLKAAAAAFTTVEKLADMWPEGYAHLPVELLAATANHSLPAPRLDDLNARLAAFRREAA